MKILKLLLIIGIIMGVGSISWAQEVGRMATVSEINGSVEVQGAEGSWMPAKIGMILKQGDSIRTKGSSWAILNVDGAAQTASVEVKQNSQMKLATLLKDSEADTQTTLLDLSLGEILIKAKKLHSDKSKFEVKTPTSIVGVRGTTFSVAVEAIE